MNRVHALAILLLVVGACSGHGSGSSDPDAPFGGGDDVDASHPIDASMIDAPDLPTGPAAFSAMPMSLNFGSLAVGSQSGPMQVRITNIGGTVSGPIDGSVQPGSFAMFSNGCTQGLRPAGVCIMEVRFQPQTAGQKMNVMTATDGTASVQVALSGLATGGNGGQAQIQISPSVEDFGAVPVNTTSGQTLTVKNVGTATSGNVQLTKSGTDFALGASTCGGPLAVNAMCTVSVSFTPSSAGQKQGQVTASANPGGSSSSTLMGIGVGITNGGLVFVPSSFNFGDVKVGDTSTAKQFMLTNNGTATVGPITITKAGLNVGDFVVQGNNCANASLDPGQSCGLFVTFEPGFIGTRTAQLRAGTGSTSAGAGADLSGNGLLAQ